MLPCRLRLRASYPPCFYLWRTFAFGSDQSSNESGSFSVYLIQAPPWQWTTPGAFYQLFVKYEVGNRRHLRGEGRFTMFGGKSTANCKQQFSCS